MSQLIYAGNALSAPNTPDAEQPYPGAPLVWRATEIKPGDVINFLGGLFTLGGYPHYGHTALYLGRDPRAGDAMFLDFEVEEAKDASRAFKGRILGEKEFLQRSSEWHSHFDVYRLEMAGWGFTPVALDPRKLQLEAMRVAVAGDWDPTYTFGELCSDAVADVLSKVSGDSFGPGHYYERFWDPLDPRDQEREARLPSFFATDRHFRRVGTTITIDQALHPTEEDHLLAEQLQKQRRRAALLRWTATACDYIETNRSMLMSTQHGPASNDGWELLREQNDKLGSDAKELLQIQVVMTKDEMTTVLQSHDWESSASDARCQRTFMRMLLEAPQPLDQKWIVDKYVTGLAFQRDVEHAARGIRNAVVDAASGIKDAVEEAIEAGAAVLVGGIKAPFVVIGAVVDAMADSSDTQSGSGASGRSHGGGGSSSSGSSSESSHIHPHSEALEQLRGISSSGWGR